jgi:hypothetical protein
MGARKLLLDYKAATVMRITAVELVVERPISFREAGAIRFAREDYFLNG